MARSEQVIAEIYARHLFLFLLNAIDFDLDIVKFQQFSSTREKIKYFTLFEVVKVIDDNLNPKKAPGYEGICSKIFKELQRKAIIHFMHIYIDISHTKYVSEQWRREQVIMLLKPGKPPEDLTSYRPISFLLSLSKF